MSAAEHQAQTDRLNGALGGIIDDAGSWDAARRFYYGQAQIARRKEGWRCCRACRQALLVDGGFLDRVDGITAAPRPAGVRTSKPADRFDLSALLWSPGGYSIEKICEALAGIPNPSESPQDWKRYNSVMRAVWLETSGSEDGKEAFLAWAEQAGSGKFKRSQSLRDWKDNGPRKADDSDFMTLVKLAALHGNHVDVPTDYASQFPDLDDKPKPKPAISPTPFQWVEPEAIKPREWLYGQHLIRKYASGTLAPGAAGKSTLTISEAVAMASGKPLLGIKPHSGRASGFGMAKTRWKSCSGRSLPLAFATTSAKKIWEPALGG